MADCPYCAVWEFHWNDPAKFAELADNRFPPLVWDEGRLRQAGMMERPMSLGHALAAHICAEHPEIPAVQAMGPIVVSPTPAEIAAYKTVFARPERRRPWWKRLNL